MKDTHEANLPTEENGKLEETKAPEPLRLRENCRKKKFWRN